MTEMPDNGCEAAPKCVLCPLPDCTYDVGGGRARWSRSQREQAEAVLAYCRAHPLASDAEVAQGCKVRHKTVQRARAKGNVEVAGGEAPVLPALQVD